MVPPEVVYDWSIPQMILWGSLSVIFVTTIAYMTVGVLRAINRWIDAPPKAPKSPAEARKG